MKNKLILLSGGMDSTVLLNVEKENIKTAITFDYNQKHIKEIGYAVENCKLLDIPHDIIDIEHIGYMLESNLLIDKGEIPEGHYQDESMRSTVVPFRNGIMLSIAAGIAESNNCDRILIAAHSGDHAIYPDCRFGFITAMSLAISRGTYSHIEIEAPFLYMHKSKIAFLGKSHNVDFSKTWSCYNGRELHCGKCGTCIERKEALQGFDPTLYDGGDRDASFSTMDGL